MGTERSSFYLPTDSIRPAAEHPREPYGALVPRYLRIAQAIRQRLLSASENGRAQLPPEPGLAKEFGVSRETLRRALGLLRQEGIIYAVPGRGNFVALGQRRTGVPLTQPLGDPFVSGQPSALTILSQGYVRAPKYAAEALGVAPGSRVYLYIALRTIGDRPFKFARVYVLGAVSRMLDHTQLPRVTISEKLEREGRLRLVRVHQTVRAVPVPREAARALRVATGRPVLVFRRVFFQDTGQAVELSEEFQDSQAFPYEETVVRAIR